MEKRLLKNTFLLYIRMIISVIISLYTSRIILEALGIEDYGIYNIVGGTVAVVGFLGATMSASTSRFLSIAIAEGSQDNLQGLFATSFSLHLILAGIILLFGESIGLWFVNNILNVPLTQMVAVNIVFQLSLFSTCISIIQIPYNALIVAHEDMQAFAYLEILNSFLKLGVAYITLLLSGNKLIIYSLGIFLIACVMRSLYIRYSTKKYIKGRVKFSIDKRFTKSLASFSGWDILGHLGFTARQQGTNIILNIFFGAVINAASGIATTVQGIISSFSNNIVLATRPHIIKTYAKKDYSQFQSLMANVSVISLLMILAITMPVIINIQAILSIWLTKIPPYCAQFTILCMASAIVSSISSVYLIGIHATGEVKQSSIGRNIVYTLSIVILYFLLREGYSPIWAYILIVCTQIVTIINDAAILRNAFSISNQLKLCIKNLFLIAISIGTAILAHNIPPFSHKFLTILSNSVIYLILFLTTSFILVLNKKQRSELLIKFGLHREGKRC